MIKSDVRESHLLLPIIIHQLIKDCILFSYKNEVISSEPQCSYFLNPFQYQDILILPYFEFISLPIAKLSLIRFNHE